MKNKGVYKQANRIKNKKYIDKGKRKEWEINNKQKLYIYGKMHKNHEISEKEWNFCKEYFNNSCAYCGLTEEKHKLIYDQQLHKEHVDHNGANDLSNCVPACKSCNSSKHTFKLGDWYNHNNEHFNTENLERINNWLLKDYQFS